MGEGSDRDQGEHVDLVQALRIAGVPDEGAGSCCNTNHLNHSLTPRNGMLHDTFIKLKRKWAAAATAYAAEHPGVLPRTKPGRTPYKQCTLLLPIDHARVLMRTWVPWALVRIQEDFARLATRHDTLSPQQLAAIDALPASDYVDEDNDD